MRQFNLKPPYEEGASLWQRIFFTAIYPLLVKGYDTPLEHPDLYQLPPDMSATHFAAKINEGLYGTRENPKIGSVNRQQHEADNDDDEEDETKNLTMSIEDGVINCCGNRRIDIRTFPFCCVRRVPPLVRVLLALMRPYLLRGAMFRLSSDWLAIINPLLLSELIRTSASEGANTSFPAVSNALGTTGYMYLLASCFFVFALGSTLLLQHHHYNAVKCVMMMRTGLTSSFYRKALRLTPASREQLTNGVIMTMISTDASRMSEMCMMLHQIWSCPMQITLSIIFLLQFIGSAAFGGLAWLILVLSMETLLARQNLKNNRAALKFTDARLQLVDQVVKNIRIVKAYGWQSSFLRKIFESRAVEIAKYRVSAMLKALITMLLQATPVLVALCTFSLYTYISPTPLTAVQAFTTLSLFSILRQPLTMMPKVLSNIVDALACFPRIFQLMNADELPGAPDYISLQEMVEASEREFRFYEQKSVDPMQPLEDQIQHVDDFITHLNQIKAWQQPSQPAPSKNSFFVNAVASASALVNSFSSKSRSEPIGTVNIPNVDFRYDPYPAPLETSSNAKDSKYFQASLDSTNQLLSPSFFPSVQLHLQPGSFCVCIGPVASGKSSLLLALLGEMDARAAGTTMRDSKPPHIPTLFGRVAYVSQTSWISNDTVRGNICFGRRFDPQRYQRVLEACALETDLKMLPAGDFTEIGERGVNLSGGQKARVALARAAYADADIYLLDSPLSALDVHVGQHIVENCLRGLLKDKTIVLVTHHLQICKLADHIVVMQNVIELQQNPVAASAARGVGNNWKIRIAEQGSFDELCENGPLFQHHMQTMTTELNSCPQASLLTKSSSLSSSTLSFPRASSSSLAPSSPQAPSSIELQCISSSTQIQSKGFSSNSSSTPVSLKLPRDHISSTTPNPSDREYSYFGFPRTQLDDLEMRSDGVIDFMPLSPRQRPDHRGFHAFGACDTRSIFYSVNTGDGETDVYENEFEGVFVHAVGENNHQLIRMNDDGSFDITHRHSSFSSLSSSSLSLSPRNALASCDVSTDVADIKSQIQSAKKIAQIPTAETIKRATATSSTPFDAKAHPQPEAQQQLSESKASVEATLKAKGKLISMEKHFKGANTWDTYLAFFRACGSWIVIGLMVMLFASPLTNAFNDLWLSKWSSANSSAKSKGSSSAVAHIANALFDRWIASDSTAMFYLQVYAYFALGSVLILLIGSTLSVQVGLNGSQILHDRMMTMLLHAPMSFFDTTPVGRILNRCSADVEGLDQRLAPQMLELALLTALLMVNLFMICVNMPAFVVAFLPAMYVFYRVQHVFRRSSRELKRLYSISKSPVFAGFSEMLDGTSTIRAFGAEARLLHVNSMLLDYNNESWTAWQGINRWLAFHLDLLGALILLGVALAVVSFRESLSPGMVGLLVGYGVAMTGRLNHMVRQSLEAEQEFSSVERVLEYTNLEPQDKHTRHVDEWSEPKAPEDFNPKTASWPSAGRIDFVDVSARYREGLDLVVKDISVSFPPNAKIGICGRTGAGKSSMLSLLFRLVECAEGRILIDGRDIATVDLEILRRSLSIIPQDPVMFDGSIRFNLDPFGLHSDEEIWQALRRCQMEANVQRIPGQLNAECASAFSVGERQLICMVRALLRPSKILVMDEATASIDYATDAIIQQMIKTEFADRTVLTIAHRLNTILWMDRIMVLDKGRLVEFDTPGALMAKERGVFRSMIEGEEH